MWLLTSALASKDRHADEGVEFRGARAALRQGMRSLHCLEAPVGGRAIQVP